MDRTLGSWTIYGAACSGSVPIEAALTLVQIPYSVIEAITWADAAAQERVAPVNPLRQVPTVILPGGEVMTESAAILIHLADSQPGSGLAPPVYDPARAQFLRWMNYVSAAIYSLHWILVDPQRIGVAPTLHAPVTRALGERIAACWQFMDAQLEPGTYLLGEDLSVLDLYVAVVSRFGPCWRRNFYGAAPRMAKVVRRVDAEPRLAAFWARRYPFEDGWEG
jgi:GST-like protein